MGCININAEGIHNVCVGDTKPITIYLHSNSMVVNIENPLGNKNIIIEIGSYCCDFIILYKNHVIVTDKRHHSYKINNTGEIYPITVLYKFNIGNRNGLTSIYNVKWAHILNKVKYCNAREISNSTHNNCDFGPNVTNLSTSNGAINIPSQITQVTYSYTYYGYDHAVDKIKYEDSDKPLHIVMCALGGTIPKRCISMEIKNKNFDISTVGESVKTLSILPKKEGSHEEWYPFSVPLTVETLNVCVSVCITIPENSKLRDVFHSSMVQFINKPSNVNFTIV